MIKNKAQDIKIIFKIYLKILKISSKTNFFSIKQFSKIVFINYFSELFFKIVTKQP